MYLIKQPLSPLLCIRLYRKLSVCWKGIGAIVGQLERSITYGFNETSLTGRSGRENHWRNSSTGTFNGRLTVFVAFRTKFLQRIEPKQVSKTITTYRFQDCDIGEIRRVGVGVGVVEGKVMALSAIGDRYWLSFNLMECQGNFPYQKVTKLFQKHSSRSRLYPLPFMSTVTFVFHEQWRLFENTSVEDPTKFSYVSVRSGPCCSANTVRTTYMVTY